MALQPYIYDRVKETSTTTGTGTLTLAGAVTGFRSFSVIGDGNPCYYTIELLSAGEFEVGIGTYTASGTTLSRTTILASSNGGAAVNFSAGTKTVFNDVPATRINGGGDILLEQYTASSSAQLDFTTFLSASFDQYKIQIVNIALATNAAHLHLEIGTGGGPTYDTGNNYEWAADTRSTAGASVADSGATGLARVFNTLSNNAGYGFGNATIYATELQSTSHRKTFHGTQHYVNNTPASLFGTWGMQWTTTATAVTALRFIASSGNIASGSIRIYGVPK